MKYHKLLVIILLILDIFCVLLSPNTLVASASEFQNISIEQIEDALNITVFYQKGADRLIKCFDVNENGYYAIGYKNNIVHIYNSQGVFQYGYDFDTDGTYGINLKGNNIVIHLARSDIAVKIDSKGKCIDVQEMGFPTDITDNAINRTSKQIGDITYCLERDIGIFDGDYSRLVKIDEKGTKTVLYDVTTKGYFAGAFHYIVISIFPIGLIIYFIIEIKKEDCAT